MQYSNEVRLIIALIRELGVNEDKVAILASNIQEAVAVIKKKKQS